MIGAELSILSVDLWAARIPVIGVIADHHWFVIHRDERMDRWEVWQHANAGGENWGHLHRNLKSPDSGVGNGPAWLIHSWVDEDASELAARIESSPREYPWAGRYLLWPGPNSNTFVQWVLREDYMLGWKAFGKRYWRRKHLRPHQG